MLSNDWCANVGGRWNTAMTELIALPSPGVGPGALTVVVTLAALGALYLATHAIVVLLPRRTASASALFCRGVGPSVLASAVALGLVLPAFLRFEPPHDGESAGVLLLTLSALGAWHVGRIMFRAARMLTLSRTLTTTWLASAAPLADPRWGRRAFAIDAGYPIVAVAGLLRPRLFVDRRVLAACSAGELDAIAAHEHAHVVRFDNLRRLVIGACAGPASVTARAWREAAERVADTDAAGTARRAVDLASALVKMARLAPPRTLECMVLSTIQDGGSLEARIRHLVTIEQRAPQPARLPLALLALVPIALAAGFNWSTLLRSAHMLTEAAVNYLP
jgi:Zn-dependent protease with chaperone function